MCICNAVSYLNPEYAWCIYGFTFDIRWLCHVSAALHGLWNGILEALRRVPYHSNNISTQQRYQL